MTYTVKIFWKDGTCIQQFRAADTRTIRFNIAGVLAETPEYLEVQIDGPPPKPEPCARCRKLYEELHEEFDESWLHSD